MSKSLTGFTASARLATTLMAAALMSAATAPTAAAATTIYQKAFVPKAGGAVCYSRLYSKTFLKQNPSVKITALTLEWRKTTSTGATSGRTKFGTTVSALTATESYSSNADCQTVGTQFKCIMPNGNAFSVLRVGRNVSIVTRKMAFDGFYKDLLIASVKGKPSRSFTLYGHGAKTCDEVYD